MTGGLVREEASVSEFVDSVCQHAYYVEVDDRRPVRTIDDVDDPGQKRLDRVAGDDQDAGTHPVRFCGALEECPHEPVSST